MADDRLIAVCLDALRSADQDRLEPFDDSATGAASDFERAGDPEQEALLIDSVGRALLVVLDRLSPAERIAFVLHDMFAAPFDEIASIVGRSTAAAKKLASRARHKYRVRPQSAVRSLPGAGR